MNCMKSSLKVCNYKYMKFTTFFLDIWHIYFPYMLPYLHSSDKKDCLISYPNEAWQCGVLFKASWSYSFNADLLRFRSVILSLMSTLTHTTCIGCNIVLKKKKVQRGEERTTQILREVDRTYGCFKEVLEWNSPLREEVWDQLGLRGLECIYKKRFNLR